MPKSKWLRHKHVLWHYYGPKFALILKVTLTNLKTAKFFLTLETSNFQKLFENK